MFTSVFIKLTILTFLIFCREECWIVSACHRKYIEFQAFKPNSCWRKISYQCKNRKPTQIEEFTGNKNSNQKSFVTTGRAEFFGFFFSRWLFKPRTAAWNFKIPFLEKNHGKEVCGTMCYWSNALESSRTSLIHGKSKTWWTVVTIQRMFLNHNLASVLCKQVWLQNTETFWFVVAVFFISWDNYSQTIRTVLLKKNDFEYCCLLKVGCYYI